MFNFHAFFGLDGLLEAIVVFAAFHDAARELVDQLNLALGVDHVFDVAGHDVVGFQSLMDTVDEILILRIIEVRNPEHLLGLVVAGVGEAAGFILDVDREIRLRAEHLHEAVRDLVLRSARTLAAGNDERRAGFVDEDGVGFVDDTELEPA